MPRQIEEFAMAWHPQHGCGFKYRTGGLWSQFIRVSPADLAAVAAIFNEQPVFLQPDGTITTGAEPVG